MVAGRADSIDDTLEKLFDVYPTAGGVGEIEFVPSTEREDLRTISGGTPGSK